MIGVTAQTQPIQQLLIWHCKHACRSLLLIERKVAVVSLKQVDLQLVWKTSYIKNHDFKRCILPDSIAEENPSTVTATYKIEKAIAW